MDDIIIYNEEWNEHIKPVEKVLKSLQEANLTVKPSKCIFGKKEIEFTGHVINDGRITPNKENVEKIQKAARPSNKK